MRTEVRTEKFVRTSAVSLAVVGKIEKSATKYWFEKCELELLVFPYVYESVFTKVLAYQTTCAKT